MHSFNRQLRGLVLLAALIPACKKESEPAIETPPVAEGKAISLDIGKGVKLELVRIPAGEFVMGSPDAEAERDPSEGPQHTVHIARDFYAGKFEVTQAQWVAVMGGNQSQFKDDPALPAECVSWGDCQKFCDEVSRRTGRTVRLPSEAEWEYFSRAGTTTATPFGDALSSTQANFNGQSPYGAAPAGENRDKPMPVGSFKPNAFGVYDTAGNVNEWCQDVFRNEYLNTPVDGSPNTVGDDTHLHVYRGGAYSNDGANCRSAVRFAAADDLRTSATGFRVVVEVK